MHTAENCAYAAALLDGEGSVLLTREQPNEHRSPAVCVPSTTYALLAFLKCEFGGTISSKKTYQKHHKQSWHWSLRQDKAIGFLCLVLPYMKEPEKIRRAKMLVLRYKTITPRNGRYSGFQLVRKKQFEDEFFKVTHVNT